MNRLKKRVKLSYLAKKTKMNNIRVENGNSGDIYDKFFRIYDPRRVFAVEFFAWFCAQEIELDFNNQSTNNFFLRVDKLQTDACWIPYHKKFDKTHKIIFTL
ncbi:hypothetical protein F8M41_023825 [Gigaspora margarita]|uniref:Uncharacterized protein n=1 Tax=Gigaspora margarita TaxID=4874 RepID=A0A8H4EG95_GIGMA|nr:hypothetical protein F8M41_023825 [Gigaspora margarita]